MKIRRADANRESMAEEFRLTRFANRVRVGAPVDGCTKDVISMRYIKGIESEDYVKATAGKGSARRVREMAHAILNQCRKLDLIGVDHGQLSNLRKHVIIEGETPYIIDFESASQNRTMKNVTTVAQFLFIGSSVAPRIKRILSIKSSDKILEALWRYKGDVGRELCALARDVRRDNLSFGSGANFQTYAFSPSALRIGAIVVSFPFTASLGEPSLRNRAGHDVLGGYHIPVLDLSTRRAHEPASFESCQ